MKNEVINIVAIPANAPLDDIIDTNVTLSLITEKTTKFAQGNSSTYYVFTYLHTEAATRGVL